jgi:hypothetical protein
MILTSTAIQFRESFLKEIGCSLESWNTYRGGLNQSNFRLIWDSWDREYIEVCQCLKEGDDLNREDVISFVCFLTNGLINLENHYPMDLKELKTKSFKFTLQDSKIASMEFANTADKSLTSTREINVGVT